MGLEFKAEAINFALRERLLGKGKTPMRYELGHISGLMFLKLTDLE